jgi:hypothetical protein
VELDTVKRTEWSVGPIVVIFKTLVLHLRDDLRAIGSMVSAVCNFGDANSAILVTHGLLARARRLAANRDLSIGK